MFFLPKNINSEINKKKKLKCFLGFVYMFVYMRAAAVIDIDSSSFNSMKLNDSVAHPFDLKTCTNT